MAAGGRQGTYFKALSVESHANVTEDFICGYVVRAGNDILR